MIPAAVKRWHGRRREQRYLDALRPVTVAYRERYGTIVLHGPFAGLRYPPGNGDLTKLTGTYEAELHDAVESLLALGPRTVVNVGAAEGYYAIGFAMRLPGARVIAYEADERPRVRCATQAELNGVEERVEVRGLCTVGELRGLPAGGVALVLDCEGAELELLRPDLVAAMTGWPILVELHDFLAAGTTDEILRRFAQTHQARVIEAHPRDPEAVRELAFLSARKRSVAVDEFRPRGMRWALLTPDD